VLTVSGASFVEFINNKIHHNGRSWLDHGLYLTGSNNLLEGNEIYSNSGYGVHIYSATAGDNPSNNIIRGNIVRDNATSGADSGAGILVASGGTNNLVYNNIVRNNPSHGIQVAYRARGTKVYNNTVYGNKHNGIHLDSTVSDTTLRNNILYQNGQAVDNQGLGTIQSNNIMGDPKFVNTAANDFRIQASSPAVNAGYPVAEVSTDFEGVARPQGPALDVGAFEYAW
jgi:parallel beta-helix repeat protein